MKEARGEGRRPPRHDLGEGDALSERGAASGRRPRAMGDGLYGGSSNRYAPKAINAY